MWKIVQCSVQGQLHKSLNIPCQDKTWSLREQGITVLALAAGVSSANHSNEGADTITKYLCQDFVQNFHRYYNESDGIKIKKELSSKIFMRLRALQEDLRCSFPELASTLLLVASDESDFIIAHIGDGVIVYLEDNQIKTASLPYTNEFDNCTFFTTSDELSTAMKLYKGRIDRILGFTLISDGSAKSLYRRKQNHASDVVFRLMKLCITLPEHQMYEVLKTNMENTIGKATQDDCSIAIFMKDFS